MIDQTAFCVPHNGTKNNQYCAINVPQQPGGSSTTLMIDLSILISNTAALLLKKSKKIPEGADRQKGGVEIRTCALTSAGLGLPTDSLRRDHSQFSSGDSSSLCSDRR